MMKTWNFVLVLLLIGALLPWGRDSQATVAAYDVLQPLGVPNGLFRTRGEAGSACTLPRLQSLDTLTHRLGLIDAAARTGFYSEPELLRALADSEPYDESHEKRLALAQAIIQRILVGTPRADIETIFTSTDGGAIVSNRGRYYFGSQVMVNVPYASTGGEFSPTNKVNGLIFVTRSWSHAN